MPTKYSIRTDKKTAEWIQTAYNVYRQAMVAEGTNPVSLNKFLTSLITDSLLRDEPLRIMK